MLRLLLTLGALSSAVPALATPRTCSPEGPPAIVAPVAASVQIAQLAQRTAVAWIAEGRVSAVVLGRYGFPASAGPTVLSAGDAAQEIAVVPFGEAFAVLWLRQPSVTACELVGVSVPRDGGPPTDPVVLASDLCAADVPAAGVGGRRFSAVAGEDAVFVAHVQEVGGERFIRVLQWAHGQRPEPTARVGPVSQLAELARREGGFVLAYMGDGGKALLLDEDGRAHGREGHAWVEGGAFWNGAWNFLLTSETSGLTIVSSPFASNRRAAHLSIHPERYTHVRAGGRSWILFSGSTGHRLLALGPDGTPLGLPTPSIAPGRAVFESVRVAIDGADGAVAWLVDGRAMWRRLTCR